MRSTCRARSSAPETSTCEAALTWAWSRSSPSRWHRRACRGRSALRSGVALAALAVAWSLPPIGWVWRRLPVARLFAVEYAACAFVLFASVALGPALRVLRDRPARVRVAPSALVLAGALVVCAGLLPSLEITRGLLTKAARRGIVVLQERGHLRQPPEIYESAAQGVHRRVGGDRAAAPRAAWASSGSSAGGRSCSGVRAWRFSPPALLRRGAVARVRFTRPRCRGPPYPDLLRRSRRSSRHDPPRAQ